MRFHRHGVYIGILMTLITCAAASRKENAEEQGRLLLKTAAGRSLLRADGNSAIRLRLSFHTPGAQSKQIRGTYDWLISDSAEWSKNVALPDYTNAEVGHRLTVWTKRNVDFNPVQAVWLEAIFRNHQYLDYPDDTIDRYFKTSENGIQLRCVDISRDHKPHTFCFDPDGNLSQVVGELNITFQYSDYRPVGQKFVPHKVTLKRAERVVLEAEVEEVSTDGKIDPSRFEPPVGAIKHDGCFAPALPKLTKTAFPKYPFIARRMGQEGLVTMYVLIASDGSVRNARVIETAGKELDEAAMTVIPQFQYEPARCGDVTVDFEMTIALSFSLSNH